MPAKPLKYMVEPRGIEPLTSDIANVALSQLSYGPTARSPSVADNRSALGTLSRTPDGVEALCAVIAAKDGIPSRKDTAPAAGDAGVSLPGRRALAAMIWMRRGSVPNSTGRG